ncbi:uncharacterized protein B4U80_07016 [Leptotrombidium deliense]|uniref:Uncharacterized protein n=1 Tax=Leptotrombidium deliense TaxID=299467 RepID=A0A443S6A4_9ACAR|nr:uncharacterized protein B4U80_07016 [Leptotrombidium deliense]
MGYEPQNRGHILVPSNEKTSFFEKICLAVSPCERAWTFERVIGRELKGFDKRIIVSIGSRLQCQELCLREQSFSCRSGEYDYVNQECRLSSEDRRTQPEAFSIASSTVDYFENQCAPTPIVNVGPNFQSSDCGYQKHENVDLRRSDLLRSAFGVEQCQALCESTRAFVCLSFAFRPTTSLCWLSSDDSISVGGTHNLELNPGLLYFERSSCLNLKLECSPDAMHFSLNTIDPFDGKIYAKEDPISCEIAGKSNTITSLVLPIKQAYKCGIRQENTGRYSGDVIIQYHPVIQRKGDRVVKLICNFDSPVTVVTNSYRVLPNDFKRSANEQLGTAIVNASATSPNIKLRITDREGLDITGARLGEELFLRIDMENDSVFDIFARDLVARSGTTEESIVLIDKNGCPTDTTIFPSLEKVAGSKSLQGKFDAFKFADDVVVRFQVNVQFCMQDCVPTLCSQSIDTTPTRSRREVQAQVTSSPITLLPDYPLHREIIVEGLTNKDIATNKAQNDAGQSLFLFFSRLISNSISGIESNTFCTSKTTLMAFFISTLIVQASVLSVCCSCIMFCRYKKPYDSFLDPKRRHNSKIDCFQSLKSEPMSHQWSSIGQME